MKKILSLFLLLFALCASGFDFTPYKRIVCFGDSITHGGYYYMYLQQYFAQNDKANPRLFINRGISGDTAEGLLRRAPEMVETDKPDLVVILIGTNDIGSTKIAQKNMPFEEAVKKYSAFSWFERNLTALLDFFNKKQIKVVLLSTVPYNESANPAIKAAVNPNRNSSGVRNLLKIEERLAGEKGAVYIDLFTPMQKNLEDNDAKLPRGTRDRIHPSAAEHLLMAQTMLGKKFQVPNAKAAQKFKSVQNEIQFVIWINRRIPASLKTPEERVAYHKKWVAGLKGGDFKYWNGKLPEHCEKLKNKDAVLKKLYQERDAAWKELYSK